MSSNLTASARFSTESRISIEFLALLSLHVPAKTRIEFHLFNQSLKANSSRIVHADATDLFAVAEKDFVAIVSKRRRHLSAPLAHYCDSALKSPIACGAGALLHANAGGASLWHPRRARTHDATGFCAFAQVLPLPGVFRIVEPDSASDHQAYHHGHGAAHVGNK